MANNDLTQIQNKINTHKTNLAQNLSAKNVPATASETMTSLIDKVKTIKAGSSGSGKFSIFALLKEDSLDGFWGDIGVYAPNYLMNPDGSISDNQEKFVITLKIEKGTEYSFTYFYDPEAWNPDTYTITLTQKMIDEMRKKTLEGFFLFKGEKCDLFLALNNSYVNNEVFVMPAAL